jgi:alpha-amylase/alpha-mannosidase (GH57 family)
VKLDRLSFCFGVHDHQPIGNFDSVLAEATERAYRPFLELVRRRHDVRLSVHCTGSLLAWLRERARSTFDLLGDSVAAGQVELLTGGFYEPILAILPDPDKRGQIERLTDFLVREFGVRPRGMWLAERVWEPHLPKALREAGVEYVLVDDSHFALAGLDPDALGGYYLTEEQGHTLAVFPISQRLRYLIPFDEVGKTVEYLEARRGTVPALTVVDDGEKFGAWPGTYEHVYRDGWLDRFFEALLSTPWVRMTTFSDVLDTIPASDRVYLPTASYREMGEWALPAPAAAALERARRDLGPLDGGAGLAALLRGGFWRGFLVKYPEVADMYWKMLRLSGAITEAQARRPGDPALHAARESLWRGQANDAYWHGVFGGC